jgi:hypothetical protein
MSITYAMASPVSQTDGTAQTHGPQPASTLAGRSPARPADDRFTWHTQRPNYVRFVRL